MFPWVYPDTRHVNAVEQVIEEKGGDVQR